MKSIFVFTLGDIIGAGILALVVLALVITFIYLAIADKINQWKGRK